MAWHRSTRLQSTRTVKEPHHISSAPGASFLGERSPKPLAAEQRQKVAHGASRGGAALKGKSRGAAKELLVLFLSPLPGLRPHCAALPRLTPWATLCRHSVAQSLRPRDVEPHKT